MRAPARRGLRATRRSRCAASPRRCAAPRTISGGRMRVRPVRADRVRSINCANSNVSSRAAPPKAVAGLSATSSSRHGNWRMPSGRLPRSRAVRATGRRAPTLCAVWRASRTVWPTGCSACSRGCVSRGRGPLARRAPPAVRSPPRTCSRRRLMPHVTSNSSACRNACSSRPSRCVALRDSRVPGRRPRKGSPRTVRRRARRPRGRAHRTRRERSRNWRVRSTGLPIA